jgi:hypothetical protein
VTAGGSIAVRSAALHGEMAQSESIQKLRPFVRRRRRDLGLALGRR